MDAPVQITFRGMERSDAVEAKVQERADKLANFHHQIMSCRVAVESLHRHHQSGNHFHVRIDVRVPGRELVAGREPDEHHGYTDVYVAIRDTFDSMRRMLEDHARHLQGEVKLHDTPLHGVVSELHPENNFGWIEASDNRRIYFHRNSLAEGNFDLLHPGAEVRFDEELGDDGPQATTVHLVGKHHLAGRQDQRGTGIDPGKI